LSEGIAGQVPLWLDVGARIQHHFYVGAYAAYGIGVVGSLIDRQCDQIRTNSQGADVSCSAHDWRFGAQFQYHIGQPLAIDPWIGAGVGYEILGWSVHAEQGSQELTLGAGAGGMEFFNLQAGVDFPVSDVVALGPFATFTLGQYDHTDTSCSGNGCTGFVEQDQDIDDKSLHNWLLFGVRSTFDF
jgi:hypothetical protein